MATALLLLSPVLYPLDRVPETVRHLFLFNPLTLPVENLRTVLFHGETPGVQEIMLPLVVSLGFAVIARFVFIRLRPGFYDVL